MKNKTGIMLVFAFAFLVLTLGFGSATVTISDISDLTHTDGSFEVTVSSNANETVSFSVADITEGDYDVNFGLNLSAVSFNTLTNQNETILVTYNIESEFDFDFGKTYSTNLETNTSVTEQIKFEAVDFCENVENRGQLIIEDVDFNVIGGFGDDDEYWYLMDEVEIEVKVENDGSWDVDNIELEWELYTTSGEKILDDTEEDFDLKDGDDDTITFTFELDEDLDEFEGENAILYIKVTGEISDSDSSYDEDDSCTDYSKEVDIKSGDKFVVSNSFKVNGAEVIGEFFGDSVNCGSDVAVEGLVTNIGDDEQEEVKLEIYSKELGIHEIKSMGDLDGFDSIEFSYNFDIPSDIDAKNYRIQFEVLDEDDDLFENSEDDESISYVTLKVDGLCKIEVPTILASLSSEGAYSGKEVVIKSTVRNNEARDVSFVVSANGYQEWATLSSVTPEVISLVSGESKEITFTFDIKNGIEGEQKFNIDAFVNNKEVKSQSVLINVEKNSIGFNNLGDWNWKVIGIVLLNVILVVAIILILRKILRK